MKIRVDAYLGERNKFDTDFLERRKEWLPYTGIYLELILKGVYYQRVDFRVTSGDERGILINQYSWNRFFLNVQDSGSVKFELLDKGKVLIEKEINFNVVKVDVPLMFSLPSLFTYPVSDIRFFANRLAENLNNGTRFVLFTSRHLENLNNMNYQFKDGSHWRLCELIFSILTERGLVIFITPFSDEIPYSLTSLPQYKDALLWYMERSEKFRVVWDLTSGFRDKDRSALVDSVSGRFGANLPLIVSETMFNKLGGEGFSYCRKGFKLKDTVPQNDRGVKIASCLSSQADYFSLRQFARGAVKSGWGVEFICADNGRSLRNIRYSFGRALYQGYCDVQEKA